MPDFYKQYRFADNDAPVQDWDQFLHIRIGAQLLKDTGDKFEKIADHVFNKVPRYYLSNEDIEDKFALLHATNTFTDPQYCTATPVEPYHIVNKEYVDACILTAQVDLSGFARLDRENIWEEPQICNSEPENRTHLTNKAYVDDRINEIEFDTTALAKLNSPNVFTAPQSVTVPATAPEHFVTKQYVDDTKTQIIDNISGFVRADLPNTFTATQTFQYTTIVPTPQTDTEAANKLYVDTKVTETQQRLGNFAALDLANTFEKDQSFKTYAICSTPPVQPYHLVNKEYADAILQGFQLPDNLASTNIENTWSATQHFSIITVQDPTESAHAATKAYVDAQIQASDTPQATVDEFGTVKLTDGIELGKTGVPTAGQVYDYVKNAQIDDSGYAKLNKPNVLEYSNTFKQTIISEASIVLENKSEILSPPEYPSGVWVQGDQGGRCIFTKEAKPDNADAKNNAVNEVQGYNYITLGYYDDGYGNSSDGLRLGQWQDSETRDIIAGMRVKNTIDGSVYFGVFMPHGFSETIPPEWPAYLGVSYDDTLWDLPPNALVSRAYLSNIVKGLSGTPTLCIYYNAELPEGNVVITFDSAGGSPVEPKSVAKGQTWGGIKDSVQAPSLSGKTFKGWAVSGDVINPGKPVGMPDSAKDFSYYPATNTYFVNTRDSSAAATFLSSLSASAISLSTTIDTTGSVDLTSIKCSKVIMGHSVNTQATIKLKGIEVHLNGCTIGSLELDHCTCYIGSGSAVKSIIAKNRCYVESLTDYTGGITLSNYSDLNDMDHPITNASVDQTSTQWSKA